MSEDNVIQFVPRLNSRRIDHLLVIAERLRNDIGSCRLYSPYPEGEFPYLDTAPSEYVAPTDDCA